MAKRALIVDDSASMRQMVGFTLESAGFEVIQGINGEDAIDALKAAGKVDVIVTDLNMPIMDGLAFIKEVRKMPSAAFTPILMLTTESGEDRKMQAKEAGATGWIVKPFQPEVLLKVIQKVMPS